MLLSQMLVDINTLKQQSFFLFSILFLLSPTFFGQTIQSLLRQAVGLPFHEHLYGGIGKLGMFERHETFFIWIFIDPDNDAVDIFFGSSIGMKRFLISAWWNMTGRTCGSNDRLYLVGIRRFGCSQAGLPGTGAKLEDHSETDGKNKKKFFHTSD